MKIFIISDNDWVKESVEKYLDFKNVIKTSSEIEDVNDVYDYKCNTCVSDRDYNMSNRYNITHPIKEFMI